MADRDEVEEEGEAERLRRRAAWEELMSLPEEPYETTVCVTHRRFMPCRVEDGCVLSTEQSDVDTVARWQWGGEA